MANPRPGAARRRETHAAMDTQPSIRALTVDEEQAAPDGLIARHTLHDAVATRVRDMIIEGRVAPGERINEVRLGAALGVSRTPLREALKTLASEGLIELQPGRGAVVRKFSPDDVHHMLEVIAELEAFAGRLAAERASDAEIAAIAAVHAEMMRLYAAGERLEYYKNNQRIHSMIVAAAANPTLAEIHANLQARMKRIRFIGNSEPGKWRAAVEEHEEMVRALGRRDGARLAAVMKLHLENTWLRVRDSV